MFFVQAPALNQIIERMKKYAGQINLKMLFAPSTIGVVCPSLVLYRIYVVN